MENTLISVSDFIAITNQTLEYAYPSVTIEGEVASFKVNQGKYVFFDLKDAGGTVGCFMTVWQLRVPIEDGMKVVVVAMPKLTQWGKFSLTVRSVRPQGEGALKKSFELLKAKLAGEGLFAPERKRVLPRIPGHVAVISSTQAAGYADFVKVLGDRWGGVQIDVAHVQVQGAGAAEQIIAAIDYFNQQEEPPEVMVIIRGGGSADDLAVFNDEPLVRAIASSRIPVMTGIGHEVDESLADLAADVRAATPSNAAQLLVPDKQEVARQLAYKISIAGGRIERAADERREQLGYRLRATMELVNRRYDEQWSLFDRARRLLALNDPAVALRRGYALLRGDIAVGAKLEIETIRYTINARVETYDKK